MIKLIDNVRGMIARSLKTKRVRRSRQLRTIFLKVSRKSASKQSQGICRKSNPGLASKKELYNGLLLQKKILKILLDVKTVEGVIKKKGRGQPEKSIETSESDLIK